jgi:ABC-type glycerol-3-phosphate transport system permease component
MKNNGKMIFNYIVMVALILLFLIPLYWLITGSLKSNFEFNLVPPTLFPEKFVFGNYKTAWTQLGFNQAFKNSMIVTVSTTVLNMITGTLAGFILSKKKIPGGKIILALIVSVLIVPPAVLLLPLYFIIVKMGMYDSLWAIIIPFAANAFTIFFMKQYIDDIPDDLVEAARIDGLGEFGVILKIITPLSTPALVTVALINFVGNWNAFTMPLVLLRSNDKFTLPLKQAKMANATDVNQWTLILAATVLSIIPVLIIFIGSQRYFVKGIMEGAVKG